MYNDVATDSMASQITSLTIVYSAVYSGADQRKHQSSASLAFVRGIHRWPMNSPHKWPVTRIFFPFDDVIVCIFLAMGLYMRTKINGTTVLCMENPWVMWCFIFKIALGVIVCGASAMLAQAATSYADDALLPANDSIGFVYLTMPWPCP